MAQIYKLNLRDSSREADIERFKNRIADCPYEVQRDVRNEMILDLINKNYYPEARLELFELIEFIRDLWESSLD